MATTADMMEAFQTAIDAAKQDLESSLEEKDAEIEALKEQIAELKQAMLTAVEAVKDGMAEIKKEIAKDAVDTDDIDTQLTWMESSIDDLETVAKAE